MPTSPIYLDDEFQHTKHAILRPRGNKRIAFGWYGGKFTHLNWLLPLLPEAHHYCEPFSGSAAVLLNRQPSPIETYNDMDGELVNFFRVLRDHPEDLTHVLSLTPYSREEYHLATVDEPPTDVPLERARRFFVLALQSFMGQAQTSTICDWRHSKNKSARNMAHTTSSWLNTIDGLKEIGSRLLRIQIENRPALDVIRLYDGPDTLFYCDPPYLHDSRVETDNYEFEMNNQEHADLSIALHECTGKVAISGYRHEIMDYLYHDWRRYDAAPKSCHSSQHTMRQESVWMNYDYGQASLPLLL
jgi:DNA adenine methylase